MSMPWVFARAVVLDMADIAGVAITAASWRPATLAEAVATLQRGAGASQVRAATQRRRSLAALPTPGGGARACCERTPRVVARSRAPLVYADSHCYPRRSVGKRRLRKLAVGGHAPSQRCAAWARLPPCARCEAHGTNVGVSPPVGWHSVVAGGWGHGTGSRVGPSAGMARLSTQAQLILMVCALCAIPVAWSCCLSPQLLAPLSGRQLLQLRKRPTHLGENRQPAFNSVFEQMRARQERLFGRDPFFAGRPTTVPCHSYETVFLWAGD